MLSVSGADHIITMDLHASQIQVDIDDKITADKTIFHRVFSIFLLIIFLLSQQLFVGYHYIFLIIKMLLLSVLMPAV
jgi:hypothetical protein